MRSLIIQSQLTIDRSVTIFTFSRSATAGAAEALREAAALGLSWSEGPRPLHLAAAPAGAGVLAVLASSRGRAAWSAWSTWSARSAWSAWAAWSAGSTWPARSTTTGGSSLWAGPDLVAVPALWRSPTAAPSEAVREAGARQLAGPGGAHVGHSATPVRFTAVVTVVTCIVRINKESKPFNWLEGIWYRWYLTPVRGWQR